MTERQHRRLAAILAADIAGYSALMGTDEARTVRDLKAHQAVVLPMIGRFRGRIIDTAGDGILAEFTSVVDAVECASAIQETMAKRNAEIEVERRMQYRMGINVGDVMYDDARIYGDGINVAARLESIAEPGGICISSKGAATEEHCSSCSSLPGAHNLPVAEDDNDTTAPREGIDCSSALSELEWRRGAGLLR